MRMNFNKEKHRLSGTFKSQLLQVERERPALIYEKFRVFQIGVNGICSSDLERMRVNAKRRRRQERHRLLDIHPWYKEMVKITSNHPLKKTLSEGERALLYQVGVRIGDKVPFTKHEFVDILKSVPTSEYMKEEVQKLIKFLKLQIGLTELEYLDAIELSGQMLTTNSTSF
ncbi:hypothetical protein HMI55_003269 [Coelomomyces lativittatus]|nr:hypothetical protein HMI55_003269 [Coelomomyces lativittatus]